MISVQIKINNETLYTIEANRIEDFTGEDKIYRYLVHGTGGKIIKHKYSDGALKLVQKLIKVMDDLK